MPQSGSGIVVPIAVSAYYATATEVAEFAGTDESLVKDSQLTVITAIIDQWRGENYVPEGTTVSFEEILCGDGASQYLFLRHVQAVSIESIFEDLVELDTEDYLLEPYGVVRKLREVTWLPWSYGTDNIVVQGTSQTFHEVLKAATCMIWQLFHTRNKLGGLIRTYPGRLREYTDGGGAITGYDSLELAIIDVLKLLLPKVKVWV